MRLLFLAALLLLASCGPPPIAGQWSLREYMSHRCHSTGGVGLVCDAESALPAAVREGTLYIEDLGGSRLRLIDVDGRLGIGRTYSNGARFIWAGEDQVDEGDCTRTREEVLEFSYEDEGLGGQRRIFSSYSEGCASASTHDEGFVVRALAVEGEP